MATGLFSGSGSRKRNGGAVDASIEDQLHDLREDVAQLMALIADRGVAASREAKAKARSTRKQAESELQDLLESGEELLSDLRGRYADTEKQVRRAMREHPLATLGAAAAIGLIAAALLRR
ncbi:DUF883 family protein [Sinorhizobium americanum]|uniref:Uncharacterized protein n=1 Tax=Sinorhizobium americanum TaxID=194963 RepID=A0A1L3LPP4_9HYPH|nr:DUF883 family protein [Sinorhizobium americanum]APG85414.1 hypothetical protein SAMCCGM7_Ch2677 [Sinorhizobium americanum CCGM7]APG92072.1 hypothetical protein SAMCFNEI73_Ch2799 [Sinorhizobium americanum]OAP34775.1 hypothetical protein ATC00_15730 [Sinorhizobium americanum]